MNEYRDSWPIRSNTQIEFDSNTIPSNELDRIKLQLIYVNNSGDLKEKLNNLISDVEVLRSKIKDLRKTDHDIDFYFLGELDDLTHNIQVTLEGERRGDLPERYLSLSYIRLSDLRSNRIEDIRRE